ncbi:molybdopterin-binding protein [Aminipila terrae]|uniref:molybdopterin-binding protein n=1 Tax=Aminipila terrae TaxID=2697030 RepID=UPI002ED1CD88
MKEINVEKAVGTVLVHDMTQIIPGEYKGPRFKKGHVVTEEDIPVLLSMGKKSLYVIEKDDKDVHENDAALRIAKAASGQGITMSQPSEGKIELFAEYDGLLKIDTEQLSELLEQDEIMLASIHGNRMVKAGDKLAGTRVIPLFVAEDVVKQAETVCSKRKIIEVKKLSSLKIGIVTTGSEVYSGTIQDKFGPVLFKKFEALGSIVVKQMFSDDNSQMISECIKELLKEGAEIVCVTGGMSVDPDDKTPAGIREAGGQIITYGAPVLPGAMFMLAYIGEIPVVGLPGCVMYSRVSIFDLIIPRLLAGEKITRKDIKVLAQGACV